MMGMKRFMGAWLALAGWIWTVSSAAGYYDPSTFDKEKTYEFLSAVEAAIGYEEFEKLRFDYAFHVAERMGPIDRFCLTHAALAGHIRSTQDVERRFYSGKPLGEDEVKKYLLPLRIRYESTARPEWKSLLRGKFEPMVSSCRSAEEAAGVITTWMAENLKLLDSPRSYRIPMRGDLDPVTVLRGKHGTEIDIAIFGVAALRSVGVAARLVWAPALRNEVGGKFWLEYATDGREWACWVPSLGKPDRHRERLLAAYDSQWAVILTQPEAPYEITGDYLKPVEVSLGSGFEGWDMSVMVQGSEGLLPGFGLEESTLDLRKSIQVGRGAIYLAITHGVEEFIMLPLDLKSHHRTAVIVRGEEGVRILFDNGIESDK